MGKTDKGRRFSIHKIWNVAVTEYIKWLFNPRIIIFAVICIFLYDYVVELMLINAEKMGCYIMILEPFIAISNSELLSLVVPAAFVVLISDFPKTDGNTMFYIQRVGKKNWIYGQILFGVMASWTYLVGIVCMTFITAAHKAYAKGMWSPLITSYGKMFPEEKESRISLLVSGRMYNNLTPVQAFVQAFLLLLLYMVILEMLLLVGFCVGKRMIGMIAAYTIIGMGSSLCGMESGAQWCFPAAHSMAWMHFDDVLKIQNFGIVYSYMYFMVVFLVLFCVCLAFIRRYDFAKITDMED